MGTIQGNTHEQLPGEGSIVLEKASTLKVISNMRPAGIEPAAFGFQVEIGACRQLAMSRNK
jgi:hypothetical protein